MTRRGFTLLEVLMVIGIVAVATGITAPLYRDYQVRSDLNLATDQSIQGLARAKLLSQTGKDDAKWGFYVPAGILYKGESYELRDQSADEVFPMPSTITTTGLLEVAYSKVDGIPSSTGSIILTAINKDQRVITITIDVSKETIATNQSDTFTICHYPPGNTENEHTLTVPDNAWPAHQNHGDSMGSCPNEASSSSSSPTSSSSAGGGGATSSSSSSAGGSGGSTCQDLFSVAADGTITTTGPVKAKFTVLGSEITYGQGGPSVDVFLHYSKNNGSSWTKLFSGNDVDGGETQTVTGLVSGNKIAVKARGYYKKQGWLTFDQTYTTKDGTGHLRVLRDGDTPPDFPAFDNQTSLAEFLQDILDAQGKIDIGTYDVVILGELGVSNLNSNSAAADFQDIVMLVEFTLTGSCP